jgi:hypothetical protein
MSVTIEDLSVAEVAALGDVVIVVREGGRAGTAYIRGHKAPMEWSVDYGTKDDPPHTIRHLAVKVGWLLKAWRGSDTEARREIAEGSPEWQELHRA